MKSHHPFLEFPLNESARVVVRSGSQVDTGLVIEENTYHIAILYCKMLEPVLGMASSLAGKTRFQV